MKISRFVLSSALVLAAVPAAFAYTLTTYDISLSGGYSLVDGQIHYSEFTQYKVFDLATNSNVANHGTPSGFSGFDAFVTYDKSTGTVYMADSPSSGAASLYTFNYNTPTSGSWNSGSADIKNGYAGAAYNGSLYFTGSQNPFNPTSSEPNPNFISRLDSTTGKRHLLVETGGWSAPLFMTGNGDVYYATTGLEENALYRWSAEELASVDNDKDTNFLTPHSNNLIIDFTGEANGIAIDDAGNIVFATSEYIAVVDIYSAEGYRILLDAQTLTALGIDTEYLLIGLLTVTGDVLVDGTLYFSSEYMGNLLGVQVPEPATYALLAGIAALLVTATLRRRQSKRQA